MKLRKEWNRAVNEIMHLYHELCVKLDISDSEQVILNTIHDEERPLTQSDIVRLTGMTKQTIHSSIRELTKKNVIRLNAIDAKSKEIVLTEEGTLYLQEKVIPMIDIENRVLSRWTQEEQEIYVKMVLAFRDALEQEVNAYEKE